MRITIQQRGALWLYETRRLFSSLTDLVFPPVCACCGRLGTLFCERCAAGVAWVEEPVCRQCGRPESQSIAQCFTCRQRSLPLRIRAATLLRPPVQQLLHRMKYEGYFALAQPLADLMLLAWPRWRCRVDVVVPIPLHPERRRQRGYNQAEKLVQHMQKQLEWRVESGILRRVRHTRPQVGLGAIERQENVRDAFVVDAGAVRGKHVLLVDDVCTTGATLAAAAEVVLAAGAGAVSAYCLATAPGDEST